MHVAFVLAGVETRLLLPRCISMQPVMRKWQTRIAQRARTKTVGARATSRRRPRASTSSLFKEESCRDSILSIGEYTIGLLLLRPRRTSFEQFVPIGTNMYIQRAVIKNSQTDLMQNAYVSNILLTLLSITFKVHLTHVQ